MEATCRATRDTAVTGESPSETFAALSDCLHRLARLSAPTARKGNHSDARNAATGPRLSSAIVAAELPGVGGRIDLAAWPQDRAPGETPGLTAARLAAALGEEPTAEAVTQAADATSAAIRDDAAAVAAVLRKLPRPLRQRLSDALVVGLAPPLLADDASHGHNAAAVAVPGAVPRRHAATFATLIATGVVPRSQAVETLTKWLRDRDGSGRSPAAALRVLLAFAEAAASSQQHANAPPDATWAAPLQQEVMTAVTLDPSLTFAATGVRHGLGWLPHAHRLDLATMLQRHGVDVGVAAASRAPASPAVSGSALGHSGGGAGRGPPSVASTQALADSHRLGGLSAATSTGALSAGAASAGTTFGALSAGSSGRLSPAAVGIESGGNGTDDAVAGGGVVPFATVDFVPHRHLAVAGTPRTPELRTWLLVSQQPDATADGRPLPCTSVVAGARPPLRLPDRHGCALMHVSPTGRLAVACNPLGGATATATPIVAVFEPGAAADSPAAVASANSSSTPPDLRAAGQLSLGAADPLCPSPTAVSALHWTPHGVCVATQSSDGGSQSADKLQVLCPDGGGVVWARTAAHAGSVRCLQGSADCASVVFSGASDATVAVWDLREAAQATAKLTGGHTGPVGAIASASGVIATGGADGRLCVWDSRRLAQPFAVRRFDGPVDALSCVPTRGVMFVSTAATLAVVTPHPLDVQAVAAGRGYRCLRYVDADRPLLLGAGDGVGVYAYEGPWAATAVQ